MLSYLDHEDVVSLLLTQLSLHEGGVGRGGGEREGVELGGKEMRAHHYGNGNVATSYRQSHHL